MEQNNSNTLDRVEKTLKKLLGSEILIMSDCRNIYKNIPSCIASNRFTDVDPIDLTFLSLLREKVENYENENKEQYVKFVTEYDEISHPVINLELHKDQVEDSFKVEEVCASANFSIDLCIDLLRQNGKYPNNLDEMNLLYYERVVKTTIMLFDLINPLYFKNGVSSTYNRDDIIRFLNKLDLDKLILVRSYIKVKMEYSDNLKINPSAEKVLMLMDELIVKKTNRENRFGAFSRRRK